VQGSLQPRLRPNTRSHCEHKSHSRPNICSAEASSLVTCVRKNIPIYEYQWHDCRARSAVLILGLRNQASVTCPHCDSFQMDHLLPQFSAPKSKEIRFESLANPHDLGGLGENDSNSMARFMKKMGDETGGRGGECWSGDRDNDRPNSRQWQFISRH